MSALVVIRAVESLLSEALERVHWHKMQWQGPHQGDWTQDGLSHRERREGK